jgi:anti-anti-sigma factor
MMMDMQDHPRDERYAAEDEARAARRQLALLADAGRVLLTSALDARTMLSGLARLAVPAIADLCTVYLVDQDGSTTAVSADHADPECADRQPASPEWTSCEGDGPRGIAKVLHLGQPQLYPEMADEQLPAVACGHRDLHTLRGLCPASAMAVPMQAGDRTIGVIVLVSAVSRGRYGLSDLMLAQELAHRAALAVENARLHEAEQTQRLAAERAVQRIGRLQAITADLATALTPEEVARVIIEHARPIVGAWGAYVRVLTSDRRALRVIGSAGFPDEVIVDWKRIPLDTASPSPDVIRTGAAVYFECLEALLDRYPAVREARTPLPPGARAILPLAANGETVGVLTLAFTEPHRFTEEERRFLQMVAQQCAQALERARLYAREHRVAVTLQQALLPAELPQFPGIAIDAAYRAGTAESDVGGDWYDAFRLPDGRVALAIGDVVGRGLGAAVVMGQVRQAIRAAILEGHPPARALGLASRVLRLAHARQEMTTSIVGVLDPLAGTFSYAAAGHPAPLLATEGRAELLPSGGLPLGFTLDRPAPAWTVDLAPGALLVLYTDGLIEARRDPTGGLAALRAAVAQQWGGRPSSAAQAILEKVGADGATDDMVVLTVTMAPLPIERLDLVVPAEPDSLRLVRQALARLSRALALDESRTFALTVAVGEAVNNAIEHAYGAATGPVAVRVWPEGEMLRVEVADQGRWRPPRDGNRGGRGLVVMRALAEAVEFIPTDHGTTVRFALTMSDTPRGAESSATAPASPRATHPAVRQIAEDTSPRGALPDGPCTIRLHAGIPVVELHGDLDLATVGQFTAALEHVAGQTRDTVILSLSDARYLDSQGIQALFRIGARLAVNRCALLLVAPHASPPRRLLDAVALESVFPIFESVDDAVAAARRPEAAT